MIKNSVILLSYNAWPLVMARLAELAHMLPYDSELVWVDNGTTEKGAYANMQWWREHFPGKLQFHGFEQNTGFPMGNNRGAELAQGQNLIFLSSDVIVHRPYFDEVESILNKNPETLIGGRLIDWAGGWNEIKSGNKCYVFPYAEGWFMALRRLAWDRLGGFDPSYTPADMEDVDLSVNALSNGMTLTAFPSGYFTHLGGKSFQASGTSPEKRMIQTQRNKKYFDNKWKPHLEALMVCQV